MPSENSAGGGFDAAPRLVEITGVAGAGKSTLTDTLCRVDSSYVRADFIRTRRLRHLARFVRSIPRLLPILVLNLVRPPRLSWKDIKLMVYVTEWRGFLSNDPRYRTGVVLLDQGPIYALVRLEAQGRGVGSSGRFRQWWDEMATSWTEALDVIVWLDASDDVLRSRIDTRDQAHAVKGEASDVGYAFIARYRAIFEQLLSSCDDPEGPTLLRFETGDTPPQVIAGEVRRSIELDT